MLRRVAFASASLLWTTAILAIVLPWHDLRDHTHWAKVGWIPFVSPPIKMADVIGNVLLYLPFGFLGRRTLPVKWSASSIVLAAALLSFSTEATQLYSHRRFPSATDLTCNLAGAVAGIYFAQPARRRPLNQLSQEINA